LVFFSFFATPLTLSTHCDSRRLLITLSSTKVGCAVREFRVKLKICVYTGAAWSEAEKPAVYASPDIPHTGTCSTEPAGTD